MAKTIILFFTLFCIDQAIKFLFLGGYRWESSCLSLTLALNPGVAFSMFAFLGEYLKFIQLIFLVTIGIFFWRTGELFLFRLPLAILFAGGLSNIVDRFMHGGVVDYVYWHCGFDFAIFNFADVIIDIAVGLFIWISWQEERKKKNYV